ncbi:hypothetical protein [Clostridium sp.]|uniref:hypothetical protein n=1 Tax=Clostridium sp. TaxID=1506 RepID=UPI001A57CB64|nr:hypothetical protein [Clostridium sp.]MBK5242160.1 hypothetical protein [Clostridium sp.]
MAEFKARVMCYFDVEMESDDIELAKENIEMSMIEEVLNDKTDESIEYVKVIKISEIV